MPSMYRDIDFDSQFLSLLTMPIRRGGSCGIVGNASILMKVKKLMEEARTIRRLPDGWKNNMQDIMLQMGHESIPRYYCLTCTTAVI